MKLEERIIKEAKCCSRCACCLVLEGDISEFKYNWYHCYCLCDLPTMARRRRMIEIWKEFIENGSHIYEISEENQEFLDIKQGAITGKRYTDFADVCDAFEPIDGNQYF